MRLVCYGLKVNELKREKLGKGKGREPGLIYLQTQNGINFQTTNGARANNCVNITTNKIL